tara:strand:- start:850 stop:1137 length:288 start_codon:yes stop_codon:yes gene_type:complete
MRIELKKAEKSQFTINFNARFGKDYSGGYETDVNFIGDDCGGWIAEVMIGDMASQGSPEQAADRLSLYLLALSRAVKGKNIKHLNLMNMFSSVHK